MCEIGRIDIATDVSLLSSHLAYPQEGHLDAALHIMGYLKLKNNSRLIFDPSYPVIDEDSFQHHEWWTSEGIDELVNLTLHCRGASSATCENSVAN
jgi:hypothetical protein